MTPADVEAMLGDKLYGRASKGPKQVGWHSNVTETRGRMGCQSPCPKHVIRSAPSTRSP